MRNRSEAFPLWIFAGGFALLFFFKTMFEGLFYSWVLKQLENHFGLMEAQVTAKFADIGLALIGAIATIWLLYRYIESNLRREFMQERQSRNDAILSKLADFLNSANEMIERKIENEEQLSKLGGDYNQWIKEVIDKISMCMSSATTKTFASPPTLGGIHFTGSFNPGHNNLRIIIKTYRERLSELISRHDH